ncbi:MAG: DUF5060 domain-containing protein [Armatimonadetes bacterium]|nr:DUF5060 domain-containing protein [Armatimonadota bacterium]
MRRIPLICTLLVVTGITSVRAEPPRTLAFERLGQDWVGSPLDEGTGTPMPIARTSGPHAGAIKVYGSTPQAIGITYYPWADWTGYTTLSFDLFLPPEMPEKSADICVYIKDRHYWWYQTWPLHDARGKRVRSIRPGKWVTYTLDISEDSTIWEPGGHKKAWYRVTHLPREFGIRVFCGRQWSGAMLLDNVRLSGWDPPLGRIPADRPVKQNWGLKLDLSARSVPVYEKLEITFDPGAVYENPFDPDVVDVTGHFLTPGGGEMIVPGFFYQDYERRRTDEGFEKLIPVGRPVWKVRFMPVEEGEHKLYVSVRDARGELRSTEYSFTATAPEDPRGLVRVSKRDPMYFEFDNGELFVPNGINMRDGGDDAEKQKGTYDFDYFFQRFEDEGLNFVRTWMCAWWGGIEWSDQYHSRFDNLRRYAMYNAWRLDYMFDLADRHDLFIELTLNSHGQLRRDKYDQEWRYNPYAARNGGYLPSPSMLFTSEQAKADFRKRYRYIVARWGYSQHLMSYDLWNEIDLSEGSNAAQIAAWHKEMARYLRSIDPWRHLICTHVCLAGGFGNALWDLDEIEYIQADAYWQPWWKKMNQFYDGKQQYRNKPMFFIEYGPQTADLPVPYSVWAREWRVAGWTGNMMPMAAPPQFWYHKEWDQYKLYRFQHAMTAFNAGHDRRGMDLHKLQVTALPAKKVFAQAMQGRDIAFMYAYFWDNFKYDAPEDVPTDERCTDGSVLLTGLAPGHYQVQWWDTVKGEIIGTDELTATGARTTVRLPEFAQDIACKLIRTAD